MSHPAEYLVFWFVPLLVAAVVFTWLGYRWADLRAEREEQAHWDAYTDPAQPPEVHWAPVAPRYTRADPEPPTIAYSASQEPHERLADTSVTKLVASIVRGLDFRDSIDRRAALINERTAAELTLADIGTDLS